MLSSATTGERAAADGVVANVGFVDTFDSFSAVLNEISSVDTDGDITFFFRPLLLDITRDISYGTTFFFFSEEYNDYNNYVSK
jgi:hypothetical protein